MRGSRSRLALLCLLLIGTGVCLAPPDLNGECLNYESYLHWIATMDTVENPIDVAIQGNYAYVLSEGPSGGKFKIIDVSDPGNPVEVGSLNQGGQIVTVRGTQAFIYSDPIIVGVNITYPDSPVICGTSVIGPGYVDLVWESDGSVIAAHGVGSNKHRLMRYAYCSTNLIGVSEDYSFYPAAMVGQGDYVFIAGAPNLWGFGRGLFVVDISASPSLPLVGQYVDNSLNPIDIAVSGDRAFLACEDSGLLIFDISDPTSPILASTFDSGLCADNVTAAGDYAYLSCADEGVTYVIDVSNPYSPVQVGGITPFGRCTGLLINGSHLYMSIEDGGVDVVAVATLGGLDPIGQFDTDGVAEDVVYSASFPNLLFAADGDNGLQVIDISDPSEPVLFGEIDTPGYAHDISVSGNYVYVADADSVQVFDVTTPSAPVKVSSVETPGVAVDIEVVGPLAYVAASGAGLQIFDVTDPTDPFARGSNDSLLAANSVRVSGQHAYMADGIKGLVIVSVSDPDNPWIVKGGAARRAPTNALDVAITGDLAYVADADSGLFIVDVSDPQSPQYLGTLETNDVVRGVAVTETHAYLANSVLGMQLIDVQDSTDPIFVGSVALPSISRAVSINQDFAFIAADSAGVLVCPSQCGAYERVTAAFTPSVISAFLPTTIDFADASLGYILGRQWDFGDGIGISAEVNPTYTFTDRGEYSVQLSVDGLASSDSTITTIYVLSEPPLITNVTDVPSDQGGYVYVNFARSGYDDTAPSSSSLRKSTEFYTIQRQDAGQWVTIATSGAYGDLYYSVLGVTQGDGAGTWTTPFRVIAHMTDGIWIGPAVSGFSEDNIPPDAPQNVIWQGTNVLSWDPVDANDLAYYRVFAGPTAEFVSASEFGTTTGTQLDLTGASGNWVFVVAVDDADLESPPSSLVVPTPAPEAPAALRLEVAVPNPFNPSTSIGYVLPKEARVHLSVYDISGRRVRVLVDEVVSAGRHAAIWRGDDTSGHRVASGTYFSRLEVGGEVLTSRMVLLK